MWVNLTDEALAALDSGKNLTPLFQCIDHSRRSAAAFTDEDTPAREACKSALAAFRKMYDLLEHGAEADDLLTNVSLWPLTQLRRALGEDDG